MNLDTKVLAKADLRRTLQKFPFKKLTGFIKGCQLCQNDCNSLNVIFTKETAVMPETVISIDGKKAGKKRQTHQREGELGRERRPARAVCSEGNGAQEVANSKSPAAGEQKRISEVAWVRIAPFCIERDKNSFVLVTVHRDEMENNDPSPKGQLF
ncbi:unnamed protein product [Menidia menidia]|uniref:(Atlantic silverside) hypothetical protein n=1 Tax=Menidia menidia TaxID=238744 RepID=A0A8S4BVA9_9TELE|nr:unnamed protein product [Menidia menidia]